MVGRLKRQEADMESCGIDLAVGSSAICVMRDGGVIVMERVVPTEEAGLQAAVAGRARMRCILEASPLAEWAAGVLEGVGHEVIVIDPRKAKGVITSKKKTDKLDARNLARMGLLVHPGASEVCAGSSDANVLAGSLRIGSDSAGARCAHPGPSSGTRDQVGAGRRVRVCQSRPGGDQATGSQSLAHARTSGKGLAPGAGWS
jgi:Transposase